VGVLAEPAGTYVQTLIVLVTATQEAADGLRAHGFLTVLDFDDDSGALETEPVGRGDYVLATIGSDGRYFSFVAHGAKQPGNQFLHVLPVERADFVLDELGRALFDVFQQVNIVGWLIGRREWRFAPAGGDGLDLPCCLVGHSEQG